MGDMSDPEITLAEAHSAFEGKIQELRQAEWTATREHLRSHAKSVREAVRKVEEHRRDTGQLLERLRADQQLLVEDQQREREQLRRAEDRMQTLERELLRLQDDLDAERREREPIDSSGVLAKIDVLAETVEAHRLDSLSQREEVSALRAEVSALPAAVEELREAVSVDAVERRLEEEAAASQLREHDKQLRDIRARDASFQETLLILRNAMEQDKAHLEATFHQYQAEVNEMQKQFFLVMQELPSMSTRLKEADDLLSRVKDHQRSIDRLTTDQALSKTAFDNRIVEIYAEMKTERESRISREEELEQVLATSRTKMQGLLTKQAESSRLASETMISDFQGQLEKEISAREAQMERVQDKITSHRLQFEDRMDAFQKSVAMLERRQKEDIADRPSALSGQKHEELVRQLRDLREAFISNLSEERAAREVADSALEDKIGFLSRFFQDIGQKFGSRSPLGSPSLRSATPQSRAPPSRATDQRRAASAGPVASGASGLGSASVFSAVGSAASGPASGASGGPVGSGAASGAGSAATSTEERPLSPPPELSEAQHRSLQQILGQNRVEVVMTPPTAAAAPGGGRDAAAVSLADGLGAPGRGRERTRLQALEEQVRALEEKVKGLSAAELRLKEPLEFRPPSAGEPAAVAHFGREDLAMDILGDVAEVLKVYKTATVLIEGHAEVPPERMDKCAIEVATARAEAVRSAIASLGVEPHRLEARGMPESASGQSVTIKILSF